MRLLGRDPPRGAQTHHGQSRQCLSRSLSAVEYPCRQFVNRCSSIQQFERRPGVFRGQHHRGPDHRSSENLGVIIIRQRVTFSVCIQGQGHACARDPARARCPVPARSKSWQRPRVERAAQRRPWRMSHQRRLSSPPASALPDRYADAVTTSSSAPSRAGEWDSHHHTSRISWLGSASGSQAGQ